MKNFKNKVVVITGAGSGIGQALALDFSKRGANLALNDINMERLEETAKQAEANGSKVFIQKIDMASREAVYSFRDDVVAHFGQVDVVINNAGVALGTARLKDVLYKDFDWVMGINFWGMIYGTKAFLPDLMKGQEAAIANVSSVFGIVGVASQGAYCSSKFAIRGFTETLRVEMYDDAPNLSVHSIHPGGVATKIAEDSKDTEATSKLSEKERAEMDQKVKEALVMPPAKAAAIIIKGIIKKKERIIVGSDAVKMDRLARIFPSGYSKMIHNQMKKSGLQN